AVLDKDRHADAVLHAVATPGTAHAGLYGAQRLPVGVTGFEAGINQFLPDQRQLIHARAEQINALTARDLGVELVLLGDAANHEQLVRRDFAARYARNDRIGAILLHVGQKVVIGILQWQMLPL